MTFDVYSDIVFFQRTAGRTGKEINTMLITMFSELVIVMIESVHTILINYILLIGDILKQNIASLPILDTNTMKNAVPHGFCNFPTTFYNKINKVWNICELAVAHLHLLCRGLQKLCACTLCRNDEFQDQLNGGLLCYHKHVV